MIERGYIHITGPEGSGKTTLGRLVLEAFNGPVLVARCTRDDTIAKVKETSPARDQELSEYREGGASGVARFRFPSDEDGDGFFCSNLMTDYSQGVLIEGDCPISYVDLEVFVAPVVAPGSRLLRKAGTRSTWAIAPTHQGLERAGLVIVNVRRDIDRADAEQMLADVPRIRADEDVRTDVLGHFGHKIPVTAVIADLSKPKDVGTKKALTRIKRALVRRAEGR